MASRLAEIYRSEKKTGGGLGSAVGKRLTEKLDPRKMLDQSGLLVSMFPSLKAYNPTKNAAAATAAGKQADINKKEEIQTDVLREILQTSTLVSRNSSITAKNSLVLPAMARDMNLMRQNMAKLVKLQGGTATNKADMFFKRAGERESMYESSLAKMFKKDKGAGAASKVGGTSGGGGGLMSELGLDPSQMLTSMAAGPMMSSIASMVSSLLMNPIVLGVLGGALLIYLAKRFAEEDLKKPENRDAPINQLRRGEVKSLKEGGEKNRQRALGKLGTQGTANDIVKRLIEDKLTGAAAESFVKEIARESNLQQVLDTCDPKLKEEYLKMVASLQPPAPQQPAPAAPPPPLPATGAGGGRGFVNPELVTPSPSAVPSNAVMTASGPLMSGSGEYVTSGQTTPSAPSPVESTTSTQAGTMGAYKARRQASMSSSGAAGGGRGFMNPTSPTPATSATVGTVPGIPIDYASYAEEIGKKESGGKYDTVNSIGYVGKYQFGAMALEDMGLVKKGVGRKGQKALDNPENWTIPGGKSAFLQNAQLQEDTMKRYTMQNFLSLSRLGVIKKDTTPQQVAGYLAASHLLGPGGALALSQGKSGSDAYGTSSATYFKVGAATQAPGSMPGGGTTVASSSPAPTATPSSPSTGVQVASASTAVADGRRQSMSQPTGGTAVVGSQPPRQTLASAQRKPGSAYDTDLISTLIGRQSATA